MSHHSNPAATPPNTGSTFMSRLFHYAIGLAIGCVITGAIISARYKAAQSRAAAAEQPGTATVPAAAP